MNPNPDFSGLSPWEGAFFTGGPFAEIVSSVARIAAADANCLIWGESGTGKNFVAFLSHRLGPRAQGPYVEIGCASLPDTLVETELFGYVRGAFTGAVQDHTGRLALANGGTLVLDELESLAPISQAKLLRVVETGEYSPIGDHSQHTIAARFAGLTQADPQLLTSSGTLRQDLFFRLNLFSLELPPLRRWESGVDDLVAFLVKGEAERWRVRPIQLGVKALDRLVSYPFPGNIRELQNLVRRLTLLSPGEKITAEQVIGSLPSGLAEQKLPTLQELEKNYIRQVLTRTGGRKSEAARILGIHRKTLLEKRKLYKIE